MEATSPAEPMSPQGQRGFTAGLREKFLWVVSWYQSGTGVGGALA